MNSRALLLFCVQGLAGCALFWAAALLLAQIEQPLARQLSRVALTLGVALPAVVTLLHLWREADGAQWREFWRRLVDPRQPGAVGWVVALALVPVGLVLGVGLDVMLGGAGLGARALQVPAFAAFLFLFSPWVEALAWRGYVLDRLQLQQGALHAAVMLAALWWLWQLPLFFVPGSFQQLLGPDLAVFWLLALAPLPFSVLMSWLYNATHGSTLATLVLQLQLHLQLLLGTASPRAAVFAFVLWCGTALALVVYAGPKTLVRGGATGAAGRVVAYGRGLGQSPRIQRRAVKGTGSRARWRTAPAQRSR